MEYRCEATTVAGFVQQLAVAYVAHGYFQYVTGEIPARKNPRDVDRRIIEKYGLEPGRTPEARKSARARRKALGFGNVQYVRYDRFFVLLSTDGFHPEFAREPNIRDVRLGMPIKFHNYAISYSGGHVHVRIEVNYYLNLKAYLVDLAIHRKKDWLEKQFRMLPFEPYAPVRGQIFGILRKVNARRKKANFEPVPKSCIRVFRRSVDPFAVRNLQPNVPELVDQPGNVQAA